MNNDEASTLLHAPIKGHANGWLGNLHVSWFHDRIGGSSEKVLNHFQQRLVTGFQARAMIDDDDSQLFRW